MDNLETDVEEIVIAWLNGGILPDGYSASGDKPKTAPETFVLVDRNGGPRIAMVMDAAQILIEVYNKNSRVGAKDVAKIVAKRIVELKQYHNITRAEVNSFVHVPDLIGQYERYNVYCDIYCRD